MHLIFGIDPGNTIGIAAVDFSGRKIRTLSIQNGGMGEAVSAIEKIGTPSIIACDVYPVPNFVLRIASSFNVRIFSPEKEIREEQKRQIASQLGGNIANNHERDALSAAVLAYRACQNRLRQIDLLEDFSLQEKARLAHFVLNGYSLRGAIAAIGAKEAREPKAEKIPQPQMPKRPESKDEMRGEMAKLSSMVSQLSRSNSQLTLALESLHYEKDSLLHKIRLLENGVFERMRRDKEISELRFKVKRLESELEWARGHGGKHANVQMANRKLAGRHWGAAFGGQKSSGQQSDVQRQPAQEKQGAPSRRNSASSEAKGNIKDIGESEVERMLREYRGKRI